MPIHWLCGHCVSRKRWQCEHLVRAGMHELCKDCFATQRGKTMPGSSSMLSAVLAFSRMCWLFLATGLTLTPVCVGQ